MTTHMSEPESPCRSLTWRDVLIPTRQSSSSSELVVDWVNRMQRPRCPDTREYAEPVLYWSAVVKLELNMSNYTWYIGFIRAFRCRSFRVPLHRNALLHYDDLDDLAR